jgi:hypothetical protein
MSTATSTATTGRTRHVPPNAEAVTNGQDTSATPMLGTVTIEIAGMDLTLPVKFGPGHVLTENQAKVLDAAYQRQFTNNQNAMAKSRAEALTKATTDAERTAKAPLTATQLAELYSTYEPSVGGTPRQSAMEKIKSDGAWRFWTAYVGEHNKSVVNGGEPVIVKAGKSVVALPSGKGAQEKREALIARLLTLPAYADRIQARIDEILAERGSKKDEPAKADTVSLSADDLM